jgi:hypothetical protein
MQSDKERKLLSRRAKILVGETVMAQKIIPFQLVTKENVSSFQSK